jgi:asparaginyl-tRNA synthetase
MSASESEAPVTLISQLGTRVGARATVQGWQFNCRHSKKLRFMQLRDGTSRVQAVVVKASVSEELWELTSGIPAESSVRVSGTVKEDARSPSGVELQVDGVEVLHQAEEYPISKKEHGPDFLLDHRHLWLRSKRQWAVMRVRSKLLKACVDFYDGEGFVHVDAPIFTPNACEGTTNLFETDYFGDSAFLSQSGQLYMEAAAMSLGKVYCLGPAFRAEKSKTRRHLTEFWQLEPEVAFNDWQDNMDLQERFLCFVVGRLLEECQEEFQVLERDTSKLETVVPPFPRISYDEALAKLKELGIEKEWGEDFGAEDETVLSEQYDRPIFVHHYPFAIKAFYMKADPDRPETALCNDCLAPEGYGEIIGAGQREDDLEVLRGRIQEHDLPESDFAWYLDLRRYGTVPHAGFGIGIERFVAWVCGLKHIRETSAFPRMLHRKYP